MILGPELAIKSLDLEEMEERITSFDVNGRKEEMDVIKAETRDGRSWLRLKCTSLCIGGRIVVNPFRGRLDWEIPSGEDADADAEWVDEFRRACESYSVW